MATPIELDESYYLFYPDMHVEIHETWPDKRLPPNVIAYQPTDKGLPWVITTLSGGVEIVPDRMVPKWCKAYALLIN